jgi:hypothetical protein
MQVKSWRMSVHRFVCACTCALECVNLYGFGVYMQFLLIKPSLAEISSWISTSSCNESYQRGRWKISFWIS